jgi:hypothetical protein
MAGVGGRGWFEYFDAKSCILSYIFADLDQFNFWISTTVKLVLATPSV